MKKAPPKKAKGAPARVRKAMLEVGMVLEAPNGERLRVETVTIGPPAPTSACGAHVDGDECVVCGYGMDVCPKCGVMNVMKSTRTCISCGATGL